MKVSFIKNVDNRAPLRKRFSKRGLRSTYSSESQLLRIEIFVAVYRKTRLTRVTSDESDLIKLILSLRSEMVQMVPLAVVASFKNKKMPRY